MKYIGPFILMYIKPITSFFINILYWIFHIFNLKKTLKKRKEIKQSLNSIEDVSKIVKTFKWRKDTIDWNPWIITIINNKMKDDCDGAAYLGKWLLKCIDKDSKIVHLISSNYRKGHAVCISKDKKIMISNHELVNINPNNWKFDVLKLFNFKYKHIVY